MSLVRLLAAGKSLVGLKESGGRYNLSGHRLLPKFEAKPNPFRTGAEAPEVRAEEAPGGSIGSIGPQPHPGMAAVVFQGQRGTNLTNPFRKLGSLLRGRSDTAKKSHASRSAEGRVQVQAELSLESVKVVRNDLSDSDVEIVMARTGSGTEGPTEEPINPGSEGQIGSPLPASLFERKARNAQAGRVKTAATALVGKIFGPSKP